METNTTTLYQGAFGTCCNDLKNAMDTTKIPNSFFRIGENGVFYQSIGFVNNEKRIGYFDQAVIYCPFCGKHLQDENEVHKNQQQ